MLTGDKLETAENIAFSCRLLQEDFRKLYLKEKDDVEQKLHELQFELKDRQKGEKISLVVEGPVIARIFKNKFLARKYAEEVLTLCDSVVCCRMSPAGKGDVVSLLKDYQQKITLAIGDGANDVNMI